MSNLIECSTWALTLPRKQMPWLSFRLWFARSAAAASLRTCTHIPITLETSLIQYPAWMWTWVLWFHSAESGEYHKDRIPEDMQWLIALSVSVRQMARLTYSVEDLISHISCTQKCTAL